jgi:hypothetical protein
MALILVAAARVRGAEYLTSQEVCLNYFFTHVNLGGTVGLATLGSPDPSFLGGICETALLFVPCLVCCFA